MAWNGGWYTKKVGPFQLQYKFPFKVKVKLVLFG